MRQVSPLSLSQEQAIKTVGTNKLSAKYTQLLLTENLGIGMIRLVNKCTVVNKYVFVVSTSLMATRHG